MRRFLFLLACALLPGVAHAQDVSSPETIANLSVNNGRFSVVVNWSAPHSDCTSGGSIYQYAVRYSSSSINEQNFWLATAATHVPASGASPGTQECADIMSLSQGHTYYVAVKSVDSSGNWSSISNVVQFTTPTSGPSEICE